MLFHRSLNEVFRSWTHVAVMRVLQDTTVGFTGNQVAREARMHPRSALKALTALEGLGIVFRQRGGRDYHFYDAGRDAMDLGYWTAAGVLIVHAAIAYADALCIQQGGVRSCADDHEGAVVLLEQVLPSGEENSVVTFHTPRD